MGCARGWVCPCSRGLGGHSLRFVVCCDIRRAPEDVFAYLERIDEQPRTRFSLVPPPMGGGGAPPRAVGTKHRELVQLLPAVRTEVWAELLHREPPHALRYRWEGGYVNGELDYRITPTRHGSRLEHVMSLSLEGTLGVLGALIRQTLYRSIVARLAGIKGELEGRQRFDTGQHSGPSNSL